MLRKFLILLMIMFFASGVVFAQGTDSTAVEVLTNIKNQNDCQNMLTDWQIGAFEGGDEIGFNATNVLTWLNLSNKQLCGVLVVRNVSTLESLAASDNNFDGIILTGLTGLKELDLSYNRLANIDFLNGCPALEVLKLDGNVLKDVQTLAQLGNLRQLDLSYNHLSNVTPLKDLSVLEELTLFHNKISDVSPLGSLSALKCLDLRTNMLADITPLKDLVELEMLELSDNNLTQCAVLAGMTKLHTLDLAENKLREVGPFANLTYLTRLNLQNNLIRNISLLTERLNDFEALNLKDNALALHQMYDPASESKWAANQKNVYFTLRVQNMRIIDYWVIPEDDLIIDGTKSLVVVEGPKYGAHFDEKTGRVIFSKPGIYTVSLSNEKLFNAETHKAIPMTKTGTIAVFETLPAENDVISGREDMITLTMLKSLYVTMNTHGMAEVLDFNDPYFDMLWILSRLVAPKAFY